MTLASLTKFSKTRFANSIRNVTINIRKDFLIIVNCLKKIIDEKNDSTIAKEREKAADTERILRKICNKKFVLQLSGISDVYEVFGKIVNYCQLVDILPFERFDKVKEAIAELKEMDDHVDHASCVEKSTKMGKVNGYCKWPTYHNDQSELQKQGKYKGVQIKKSFEKKTPTTRLSRRESTLNLDKDPIMIPKTEVTRLFDDLIN